VAGSADRVYPKKPADSRMPVFRVEEPAAAVASPSRTPPPPSPPGSMLATGSAIKPARSAGSSAGGSLRLSLGRGLSSLTGTLKRGFHADHKELSGLVCVLVLFFASGFVMHMLLCLLLFWSGSHSSPRANDSTAGPHAGSRHPAVLRPQIQCGVHLERELRISEACYSKRGPNWYAVLPALLT
jgi:hypothetical protein